VNKEPDWILWAREIQAIAQTGLHFSESVYDRERYERLREIAVAMFANRSDATESVIRASFAAQTGYATPKVDVRGVVLRITNYCWFGKAATVSGPCLADGQMLTTRLPRRSCEKFEKKVGS
jgi:hypothetical protein